MAITVGQGPNVNVSKLNDNQQEMTVAINPANPAGVFIVSKTYHGQAMGKFDPSINIAYPALFKDHTPGLVVAYSYSTGGGWSSRISFTGGPSEACIGERSLPAAYTDPQASYDDYGNLYLTYMSFLHQFGLPTGSGASKLIDSFRQWTTGMWVGRTVVLRPGGPNTETQAITANDATSLTVGAPWTDPPSIGTAYAIVSDIAVSPAIVVLISTNGGQSFQFLSFLDSGQVDYPAVATGPGRNAGEKSVWLAWMSGYQAPNQIKAAGAAVNGLGTVGAFTTEVVPAPVTTPATQYAQPRMAVGPAGQPMVAFIGVAHTGDTTVPIYTNVDDSGLNFLGFRAAAKKVADTTVLANPGPPQFIIPAQPNLGILPQNNLAWDRSGDYVAAPNGRVHLIYTYLSGPNDTDIAYSHSDDSGATWSPWVLPWANNWCQFLPAIAVDQTNGDVAVVWLDSRNDNANIKVQLFTAASGDGGATWLGPYQVAQGQSDATRTSLPEQGTTTGGNAARTLNDTTQNWTPNYWRTNFQVFVPGPPAQTLLITANTATQLTLDPNGPAWAPIPAAGAAYKIRVTPPPPPPPPPPASLDPTIYWHDFGDYTGVAFYNGVFYAVWPDNSNSTGDNPNGTRDWLDVYTARLTITRS
jgi:hypothetical protein